MLLYPVIMTHIVQATCLLAIFTCTVFRHFGCLQRQQGGLLGPTAVHAIAMQCADFKLKLVSTSKMSASESNKRKHAILRDSICRNIHQLTNMNNPHIKGTSNGTLLVWHVMVLNNAHIVVTKKRVRAGLLCLFNCTFVVSLAATIVCQDNVCTRGKRPNVYLWRKIWYSRVILESHCK